MIDDLPLGSNGQTATLDALARDDLDLWSVEALEDRIARLKREISRTEDKLARKRDSKSAADALFSFKGR
ncbi:MAG: DUF1192 domain-containing protein [Asticcacaulis sp.]